MKIQRSQHLSIAKSLIYKAVLKDGPDRILKGWKGTKEEALQAIQRDPREWITDSECDNQSKDGRCLGHEEEKS